MRCLLFEAPSNSLGKGQMNNSKPISKVLAETERNKDCLEAKPELGQLLLGGQGRETPTALGRDLSVENCWPCREGPGTDVFQRTKQECRVLLGS